MCAGRVFLCICYIQDDFLLFFVASLIKILKENSFKKYEVFHSLQTMIFDDLKSEEQ